MLSRLRHFVHAGGIAPHVVSGAFACGLCTVLFFCGIEQRALWSSHEGRAGQHAQLMLDGGEWGMPALYSVGADWQKPPLYYWMVAATAWLRGGEVDAWSIRFPAAVSAVGCVFVVYALAARSGGATTGLVAALALACNLRFGWLARVGRIDMPLTLAVTTVMVTFWLARTRRVWLVATYLAASVAVMLKGPVGLVLPGVAIGLFLVVEREHVWPWQPGFGQWLNRLGVAWGAALVAALAAPWFVWAGVATRGEFLRTFFLHHHWNRALGAEGLKPGPVWYYVPQLMFDFFPWSLPAIPVLARGIRNLWACRARPHDNQSDPAAAFERYLVCWCVGMFLFLSFVRFKRHDYLLPVLPGLALLLGVRWNRVCASAEFKKGSGVVVRSTLRAVPATTPDPFLNSAVWQRLLTWCMAVGAFAVGLAVCVLSHRGTFDRLATSGVVDRWLDAAGRIMLERLGQRIRELAAPTFAACAVMIVAACIAFWAVRRCRAVVAAVSLSMTWAVFFMGYMAIVVPTEGPLHDQRPIAAIARRLRSDGMSVYYYGREDQQLMFYLGSDTKWLYNRTMLRPVISGRDPVLVLMDAERLAQRQADWPDVVMRPIVRNTDNAFGAHDNPVVLVANEAAWRLVQKQQPARAVVAN
jgi:4-amino-4-deoxy-L-arabinose transferase-like glycosyltransferase